MDLKWLRGYSGEEVATLWICESKALQKGHKHIDEIRNQGNGLDYFTLVNKNGIMGMPTFRQ